MESNKIRLIVSDNPFTTEKVVHEVERDTYRNLFLAYTRNKYPIEQAIFVDHDQRITDLDSVPTSDNVIIKIVPDGGTAEERKSSGKGFLAFAASVFLLAILAVATAGFGLAFYALGATAVIFAGMGGALVSSANQEIAARRDKASQQVGIRGSKNRVNLGGRIPITVGRHLIFPDVVANPFVENIPNTDDQYVYMILGFGYKDVIVDESTLKFGDLPFSHPSLSADLVTDIDYGVSTQHSLYAKRIRPVFPGTPIYNYPGESPAEVSELNAVTGSNTYFASVGLSFPSGICRYEKDSGDKQGYSIPINITIASVENPGVSAPITSFTYTTKGSSTIGVGTSGSTLTLTDSRVKPMRRQIDIDLQSNATVWNASPSKTFTILITASSTTKDPTYVVDRAVVEFINYQVFNGTGPTAGNIEAIPGSIKENLTTMALRVRSSDSIQGVLDQVSAVVTLNARVYSPLAIGTGIDKWQTLAQTQNPASAFLYLLTNPLINPQATQNLQRIDWDSMVEFYEFCEAGGYSGGSAMQCNIVFSEDTKLEQALSSVTSPYRSMWTVIDGKFRIITDKPNPYITQYFTPKNSRDFTGAIVFGQQNDALKVSFVDEEVWEDREIVVYRDPNSPTEDNIADFPIVGITTQEHAHFLAKYALATQSLRPEQFSFTADIESIVCVIGDRIQITSDSALIGLDTTTRVLAGVEDAIDSTKFKYLIVDEEVYFENGKDYGIVLRPQLESEVAGTDENILRLNIIKPVSNVNLIEVGGEQRYAFELETSILKTKIYPEMLCMPGERGQETFDLIIQAIRMTDTYIAEIEAFPYSPDIYTAEQGVIPAYVNRITTPPQGIGEINTTGVYDPAKELAELQDIARDSISKVSFGQLVDGLEDGTTITTLLPPNLALSSQGRTVAIAFAQPLGVVSSTYRHELQISIDQVNWYSIQNPGSDPIDDPVGWQASWQGSPDPVATTVFGFEYVHNRIPFAGTEGLPLARTYYYRARAVTGVSFPVYSAWAIYAITIQPLVTLDFDSGSITADKISANAITTDKIVANSITADKLDVSLLTTNNIQSPNYVAGTTGFRISADGTLDFREGVIGGWLIGELTIKSQDASARVELNKEFNRVAIFDDNTTKVALGYLDGLQKQDGSGVWGPTDYGLWVRPGDTARFDGDINYEEGKMFIQSDASIVIDDGVYNNGPSGLSLGFAGVSTVEDIDIGFASITNVTDTLVGGADILTKVVIRLGTINGEKGLFVNEDYFSGEFHAEYLQNRFYVGSPGQSISWNSGTLTVEGNIVVQDGSITAEKVDFESVFAQNIIVQPNGSISSGFDTLTGLPVAGGFWLQGPTGVGYSAWVGDATEYIRYDAGVLEINTPKFKVDVDGNVKFFESVQSITEENPQPGDLWGYIGIGGVANPDDVNKTEFEIALRERQGDVWPYQFRAGKRNGETYTTVTTAQGMFGNLYSSPGKLWSSEALPVAYKGDSNLRFVHYNTGTRLFACGDVGTLIKSNDLGVTWESLPNMFGTTINDDVLTITSNTEVILAAGDGGRVARSVDGGMTFTISSDLDYTIRASSFGNEVFILGTLLGDVYRSTDNGLTWGTLITTSASSTSTNIGFGGGVFVMSAGGVGELIRSTDNGVTWSSLLTTPFTSSVVYGIGYGSGIWLATSTQGIARSTDGGLTWGSLISNPFGTNIPIYSVSYDSNRFYIYGGFGNIAYSDNGGVTWSLVSTSLDNITLFSGVSIGSSVISVGSSGTICYSSAGGLDWGRFFVNPFGVDGSVQLVTLNTIAGALFAGGTNLKMSSSFDGGLTWRDLIETPFTNLPSAVADIAYADGVTLAISGLEIARSTDGGLTWGSLISNPFGITGGLQNIRWGDNVWIAVHSEGKIARSTDGGLTWGSLISNPFGGSLIRDVMYQNGVWIAVGDSAKIARSTDGGLTWGSLISNPFDTTPGPLYNIYEITYINSVWVAVADIGKIARSTDGGLTWGSLISNPFGTNRIMSVSSGDSVCVAVAQQGQIARSTDNGITWTDLTTYTTNGFFKTHFHNGAFFIVGSNGVIIRSSDLGITWSLFYSFGFVSGAKFLSNYGLMVGSSRYLATSSDGGNSWNGGSFALTTGNLRKTGKGNYNGAPRFSVSTEKEALIYDPTNSIWKKYLISNETITANGIVGNTFVYTTGSGKVLLSSDDGVSWQLTSPAVLSGKSILSIETSAQSLIAMTSVGEIFKTADGVVWEAISSLSVAEYNHIAYGDGIWVITGKSGAIHRSVDDGSTWEQIIVNPIISEFISSGYGDGLWIVLTQNGIVYRSIDFAQNWTALDSGAFASSGEYRGISFSTSAKKFFSPGSLIGQADNLLNSSSWAEAGSGITSSGLNGSNQFVTFSNGLRIEFNDAGAVTYIGYN